VYGMAVCARYVSFMRVMLSRVWFWQQWFGLASPYWQLRCVEFRWGASTYVKLWCGQAVLVGCVSFRYGMVLHGSLGGLCHVSSLHGVARLVGAVLVSFG